jgi:peptidoglycan/xylan/chitin deacetylase (PgdA/CDA1 family)
VGSVTYDTMNSPEPTIAQTLPTTPSLDRAKVRIEAVEPWRDGARAAYSLVHEDLCDSSTGTLRIAVPALRTRGMRAGLATTVTLCSDSGWAALRTLAMEGFEIVNHGWWHQDPTPDTVNQEVEEARKELQRRTGANITFYTCPQPLPEPEIVRFALQHGHLGVRSGSRPGVVVLPGEVDPEDIPFDPYGSSSRHGPIESQLDTFLESAIDQRAWALRGLRGVADTSWEPVPEGIYIRHLDRLAKLVKSGDVWVAPPSEVLRHALAVRIVGSPVLEGSELRFPHATPANRQRAQLSVLLRCEGAPPVRLMGEQNEVSIPCMKAGPGLWRIQVDPWEPAILDAHF